MKNKYFKTTAGIPIQVFVTLKGLAAYADSATNEETLASSATDNGSVAITLDSTGDVTSSALTAGTKFRVAQKNSVKVKYSNAIEFRAGMVRKVAYTAPVKQVTKLTDNAITVTANKNYTVEFLETTLPAEPMPRWFYEVTSVTGDTIYNVFSKIAAEANDPFAPENDMNKRLVNAIITQTGGTTTQVVTSAPADVTGTATNGSTTVTLSGTPTGATLQTGDLVAIGGDVYKAVLVSGTTLTIERPYAGVTGAGKTMFKITGTPVYTIEFTAINFGDHFRLMAQENLETAIVTYTTPFQIGSGTPEHVTELQSEGWVYEGYGTANVAFAPDYGVPDNYVASDGTYVLYFINYYKQDESAGGGRPTVTDKHFGHIIIAVHDGDASEAALDTIFGL